MDGTTRVATPVSPSVIKFVVNIGHDHLLQGVRGINVLSLKNSILQISQRQLWKRYCEREMAHHQEFLVDRPPSVNSRRLGAR